LPTLMVLIAARVAMSMAVTVPEPSPDRAQLRTQAATASRFLCQVSDSIGPLNT
jgi:hypothetical protein